MSDAPIISLAERSQDSKAWSAEDALREALADVESGEVDPKQMVIHFFEENAEQRLTHHYYVAGVSYAEHIALLTAALQFIIDEWRGDG